MEDHLAFGRQLGWRDVLAGRDQAAIFEVHVSVPRAPSTTTPPHWHHALPLALVYKQKNDMTISLHTRPEIAASPGPRLIIIFAVSFGSSSVFRWKEHEHVNVALMHLIEASALCAYQTQGYLPLQSREPHAKYQKQLQYSLREVAVNFIEIAWSRI